MLELYSYVEPNSYEGCLYGDEERRNVSIKRGQAAGAVLCITVSMLLLYNPQLRRLYLPLAKIVNASLIMRFVGCVLYFVYYPYAENEGNCAELVVSRLYAGVIMLGELHQVYLLANFLGLGRFKLRVPCLPTISFSLTTCLNVSSAAILLTIFASLWFRKLLMIKNLWTFMVSCMQIYFIRHSRLPTLATETQMITGSDTSVRIFEKLSLAQLLPSAFSFAKRVSRLYGVNLFGDTSGVPFILDEVCIFVFYMKVLVISENAELLVEIVED